ncbi:MAG: hypothetical protein JKY65_05020 [Planctomycetes bacterium]|nr:hypothetical protein [Planctomycetota bacterium]
MQRLIQFTATFLLAAVCLLSGCAGSSGGMKIYERGMDEANAGNLEAAVETLRKGVGSFPGNLDMRLGLARLQFERGMVFHERELQLRRTSAALFESDRSAEGTSASRGARAAHRQAEPLFKSCEEQVDVVVRASDDPKTIAWASSLGMRVALFFEDYQGAYDHISRAINEGKPTGQLLTKWRNFQASLREKSVGVGADD